MMAGHSLRTQYAALPPPHRQRPKGLRNPGDLRSVVSARSGDLRRARNPGDLPSVVSARSGDLRRARARRGLSLLEVILAVAILGGCLAVTGELVRMGVRHAEEARELTRAQLLCESKMEEIAARVTALESASMVPFETAPEWTYTVDVSPLDQQQLTLVRVTVQELESDRLYPITFTLSRWILNSTSSSGETSTGTTTEGGSSGASN